VKVGSGAFMADAADAHALAESLVRTAQGAGA
jgi:thymidine phosphorylase